MALPWLILDGGGSTLAAGLVFTLTVLPYVVFGLPAGVVGDRYPRRRTMWIAHAVQAGCAIVIPLWSLSGHPPLGVVLAAAFLIGAGRVFADAAAFGAIATMAGRAALHPRAGDAAGGVVDGLPASARRSAAC